MAKPAAMNTKRLPAGGSGPHIVILAGGTASRNLTIALSRQGARVTRIVPAWDSGGSSKLIRERLGILPVGDIRQALMTMAYAEGHSGDVVRICNARLSETGTQTELMRELAFYSQGTHPALKAMKPAIAETILRYLGIFMAAVGEDFDLRRGSIGNFILSGALLAEEGDINAAIRAFRALCGISGHVWPVSRDRNLLLVAELKDGRRIEGQHLITGMAPADAATGIASVTLTEARPNPEALAAIRTADGVIYGPGSFYTSILPHLLVGEIAATIARVAVPKILIGNMLEDNETRGLGLDDMARRLCGTAKGAPVLTHMLAHEGAVPVARVVGASRFVARAPEPATGVDIIARDFEDPWHRGQHDAGLLTATILHLLQKGL